MFVLLLVINTCIFLACFFMNTCSLEKYVIPNFCCRMQLESEQAHIDTNCVCVCVLTVYITLTQAIVQDNFSLAEIDCYNSCMVDAGIVSRVRSTTRVQVDVPNACAMCM